MKNSNSGLNDVVVSKAIEHEIYLCLEFELNMDFFYVSSEKRNQISSRGGLF